MFKYTTWALCFILFVLMRQQILSLLHCAHTNNLHVPFNALYKPFMHKYSKHFFYRCVPLQIRYSSKQFRERTTVFALQGLYLRTYY